jgi:hypothetical protein
VDAADGQYRFACRRYSTTITEKTMIDAGKSSNSTATLYRCVSGASELPPNRLLNALKAKVLNHAHVSIPKADATLCNVRNLPSISTPPKNATVRHRCPGIITSHPANQNQHAYPATVVYSTTL